MRERSSGTSVDPAGVSSDPRRITVPGWLEGRTSGSAGADRPPSFNVHGVLYVEDEEKTAPVEHEIRELSNALQLVKDEQAYLVVRERVHRDSESSSPERWDQHKRPRVARQTGRAVCEREGNWWR